MRPSSLPASPLRRLSDASRAARHDTEQALVALACAACDAVASWEKSEREPEFRDQSALSARLTSWRGELDDLRVQAALAQMELRDSPLHSLATVEQKASTVEKLLVGSVREIGAALSAFRAALRPEG